MILAYSDIVTVAIVTALGSIALAFVSGTIGIAHLVIQSRLTRRVANENKQSIEEVKSIVKGNGKGNVTRMLSQIDDKIDGLREEAIQLFGSQEAAIADIKERVLALENWVISREIQDNERPGRRSADGPMIYPPATPLASSIAREVARLQSQEAPGETSGGFSLGNIGDPEAS